MSLWPNCQFQVMLNKKKKPNVFMIRVRKENYAGYAYWLSVSYMSVPTEHVVSLSDPTHHNLFQNTQDGADKNTHSEAS